MQDLDGLQELCRTAASSTALRPPEPGTQASVTEAERATDAPVLLGSVGDNCAARAAAGLAEPQEVSQAVVRKLNKAVRKGYLTDPELGELEEKFSELAVHASAVQKAVIEKFLSLGPGNLRWVPDKGAWLSRCLQYAERTNSTEPHCDGASPISVLMGVLADHALLPDVLSQQCWDTFSNLTSEEQTRVTSAVRVSIPINVTGSLSDHFINICLNEQFVYKLETLPPPRMLLSPPPLEWENIEGTLYHRLLQQFLFRPRNCEERFFKELADADPDMHPGDPGSLLHTHKATEAARCDGSAEVLALLHAGAASGLVRACARLIAEGLDVNECTGIQRISPLHVAAARGEVDVLRVLLERQADPRIVNGDGYTPLFVAVETAVQLQLHARSASARDRSNAPVTHYRLQIEACNALILAGAESAKAETLALDHNLLDLRNFMRLNKRLRRLKLRGIADQGAITALHELQYETAGFAITVYEKHLLPHIATDVAAAEFRTLISSDFIQGRDQVQRLGNRLAKRLHLGKKAVDVLRDLPPEAALHVLTHWQIEETVPGIFMVPEHLNDSASQQTKGASPYGAVGDDGIHQENGDANGADATSEAVKPPPPPPDLSKLQGKIRKWDPERGFGFIVQDASNGQEVNKDIFVHRTNVVGSNPTNHIDLRENIRVTYRLGEQDGKARALEVTMVDSSLQPLPIHRGIRTADTRNGKDNHKDDGNGSENDVDEDDDLTRKFIRFVRSRKVQDVVREKRAEGEQWLRCVGLRKTGNRRMDDAVWRKEIERRIDVLVERNTTPLQKKDFDFRVKRFLHEFCGTSPVSRASELLSLVETSTAGKSREDVRSWPAYLATLLRRFDPKLYENLADRDRRSRLELRSKAKEDLPQGTEDGYNAPSHEAVVDVIAANEEDDEGYGSPRPDITPRSSAAASSPRSSASDASFRQERETSSPAAKTAPPPDLADPTAGPGVNLFRFAPNPAPVGEGARTFQ